MSAEDTEDSAEKEFDPTPRRLEEARARGEVARAPDVDSAAAYLGFLLAALVFGAGGLMSAGAVAAGFLDHADHAARLWRDGAAAAMTGPGLALLAALAPFFLIPAVAVVVSLVAQRALVFAPEKLMPKLSRISPKAMILQKFGRAGLFEFGKSTVKLAVIGVLLAVWLALQADVILGSMHLSPGAATIVMLEQVVGFLVLVCVIAVVLAAVDWMFQRAEHVRRLRMSRREMMDEMKSSEGDPHVKAQRRERGMSIATNRMLADVPRADVVIVNPTHYAVALRWDRSRPVAPVCVAKGTDEIAARIRERAALAGVPIHRDPPTARALHAAIDIGQEIQPEHYRAVAAAIRFADAIAAKAKARRGAAS